MTYRDYRMRELTQAIIKYNDEMEDIHVKRLDIARQEIEAWKELQQVLLADAPEKLSKYFKKMRTSEDDND